MGEEYENIIQTKIKSIENPELTIAGQLWEKYPSNEKIKKFALEKAIEKKK